MHTRQGHHHPPLAWRKIYVSEDAREDRTWWRTIPLCGLYHDEYHTLLNRYIKLGGVVGGREVKSYSRYVRTLVKEAWDKRPVTKQPYTIVQI